MGDIVVEEGLIIAACDNDRDIVVAVEEMEKTAHITLGIIKDLNPFMILGFLALPVIPELRITPKGLFGVVQFTFSGVGVG